MAKLPETNPGLISDYHVTSCLPTHCAGYLRVWIIQFCRNYQFSWPTEHTLKLDTFSFNFIREHQIFGGTAPPAQDNIVFALRPLQYNVIPKKLYLLGLKLAISGRAYSPRFRCNALFLSAALYCGGINHSNSYQSLPQR